MAVDLSFLRPAEQRTVAMAVAAFLLMGAGFGARALLAPPPPPVSADAAAALVKRIDSLEAHLGKTDDKLDAVRDAVANLRGELDGVRGR